MRAIFTAVLIGGMILASGAIAEDYMNIAGWLRNLSPPATQGVRSNRWSER